MLVLMTAAGVVLTSVVAFSPDGGGGPFDYGLFGPAGRAILTGRLGEVFSDPVVQAGPLELMFWGVPALLGVSGFVPWTIFSIVACSLFAIATALAVHRLVRHVAPQLAAPIAAGVAAVGAFASCFATPLLDGHPADAVMPALWIAAALLARADRPAAAAAVLASGTGWEVWALLGVPVLLLVPRIRAGTVLRAAGGGAAVIAALFGPFLLAGPVRMFGFGWPIRDDSLVHLLFPDADEFTWPMRLTQAVLAVGAGVAVALLLRRRLEAVLLVPLAVTAVRLLTDPVLADYYFDTAALLGAAALGLAVARRDLLRLLVGLLLLNAAIDLRTVGWPGAAVLVVVVAGAVVVERTRRTG